MKIGGREEQEQGGGQNPILEAILFIPHFLLEKDGLYLALVHPALLCRVRSLLTNRVATDRLGKVADEVLGLNITWVT